MIGLISGTSLDAVDAALVELHSEGEVLVLSLLCTVETSWPPQLRDLVRGWSEPDARVALAQLGEASSSVAELFAGAAREVARRAGIELAAVDLVASHGQTVHHAVDAHGRARASLQIGQPALIAELTGRTVVADFRPRDIAAGGQGAPLVSFLDALLFAETETTVATLNLGGIANLTIVPAGAPFEAVAFDSGPGNSLLDGAARRLLGRPHDGGGAAAARGRTSRALLAELLDEPYFDRPPPKSTGRELFGEALVTRVLKRAAELGLRAEDVLATLVELSAVSVAQALARWSADWPAVVHVSGGGARNAALMRALERALAAETPHDRQPPVLRSVDEVGLPSEAKEAVCFAILGHEAVHGRPNNLPASTGARQPVVLGAIWPGANYSQLMEAVSRPPATHGQRIGRIEVRPADRAARAKQGGST